MPNPSFYFVCVLTVCLALGCETAADSEPDDAVDAALDQSVTDGAIDLGPAACQADEDCRDDSSCTTDKCLDGRCAYERIEGQFEIERVMDAPEGVVAFERSGDLLYIARGELGTQAWDVGSIPPRKLLDYARAEDEAPHAGAHYFDGGVVIRSGRWIYIVDSTGRRVGEYRSSDEVRDILSLGEQTVALALYSKGIEIVDLGNGIFPMRVGRTDTLGRANELLRIEDRLAVADGLLGISVVNIADPTTPILQEETLETSGRIDHLSGSGQLVVADEAGTGIGFFKATQEDLRRTSRLVRQDNIVRLHASDPATALAVTGDGVLNVYDASDLDNPGLYQQVEFGSTVIAATYVDRTLTALTQDGEFKVAVYSCGLEGEASLPSDIIPDGGALDAATAVDGGAP
ncbi:MAG: hypothetical protein ACON3Z_05470 [Bradymonadia bacterium]